MKSTLPSSPGTVKKIVETLGMVMLIGAFWATEDEFFELILKTKRV